MWVLYRPISAPVPGPGRYEYREILSADPGDPAEVYRHIDLNPAGVDSVRFASAYFFLGSKVWGGLPPGALEGWWGFEMTGKSWSQIGSFIVVEDFRHRVKGENGFDPWAASLGEYLLRRTPVEDGGFFLWWNGDAFDPGFWTRFYRTRAY
jgi:hypothetical protein